MLTDKEVIDAVEREEVGKLAQAAQKAANKLVAVQKKSRMEEIRAHKRLRIDTWEVARLDNEALLEMWEATKLAICKNNLDLPPKLRLAL